MQEHINYRRGNCCKRSRDRLWTKSSGDKIDCCSINPRFRNSLDRNGCLKDKGAIQKYFMKHVKITVSGKVQGVFFRRYTRQQALKLRLRGYVKNLVNGDVEIVAQGGAPQVDRLIEWAKSGSPAAEVNDLKLEIMSDDDEFQDFAICY